MRKEDSTSITVNIAVDDSPDDHKWAAALEGAIYDRVYELESATGADPESETGTE